MTLRCSYSVSLFLPLLALYICQRKGGGGREIKSERERWMDNDNKRERDS
jgi:hypothetical protein